MLSEEKISHLSHILLKELISRSLVELKDEEGRARRQIKQSIIAFLKLSEDIDAAVRKKLQSFSRKITEGSQEWEVLYRKFYDEESARKGMSSS